MTYVHSDERKHLCKICDAGFKQKKQVKEHKLSVHGINQYKEKYHHQPEEKRYPCQHCDSTYKQQKYFKCDQCASTFKQKKNLAAHMKLKHGGANDEYPCPMRKKTFIKRKIGRNTC